MEYRYIRYACAEGIATLTIDRPEVRNAMNNDCWRELTSLIQQADQDPGVRVVILTGAGGKGLHLRRGYPYAPDPDQRGIPGGAGHQGAPGH